MVKKIKSQISIFLIIAVMVIFLMTMLIYLNNDDKKNKIEETKLDLSAEKSNIKLFPFKDNVDYCLDLLLKKALIISGLRGGFIYDDGESYTKGIIPENTYNSHLISNFNIPNIYLEGKALIMSQYEVYVPKIDNITLENSDYNGNQIIDVFYNHSIIEDFEIYILDNFIECINFEEYKKQGYEVIFNNFSGKIIYYNNDIINVENNDDINNDDIIKVENMRGFIGDRVILNFLDTRLFGKIIDNSSTNFQIQFDNPTKLKEILNPISIIEQDIFVRNLNSSININVSFQEENVLVNIYFPVTIKNANFEVSFKDSQVIVPVRFKKLLEIGKQLLQSKYYNHSLNYSNYANVKYVLNKSNYYLKTNFKNITILKTINENSQEHKKFIYSIIDYDSKIYSKPYVLNLGYENEAPLLDFDLIHHSMVYGNEVVFDVIVNEKFEFNLSKIVVERQWYDGVGGQFFFHPYTYLGSQAEFSIDKNGLIKFIAYTNDRYEFSVEVEDGEAIREMRFIFIVGSVDNSNNKAALNCFEFKNPTIDLFPKTYTLSNNIFNVTNSNGYNDVFGYYVYYDKTSSPYNNSYVGNLRNLEITFKPSCLVDPEIYTVNVSINGIIQTLDMTKGGKFNITPNEYLGGKTINILVDIYNQLGIHMNSLYPFNLTLYPAACLGPADLGDTVLYGGSGTCCDLNGINESLYQETSNRDFYHPSNNNLLNGVKVIDADMYFCFDPTVNYFDTEAFDYTTGDLWKYFSENFINNPTSLFKGTLIAKCKGNFPISYHNIENITSGNPDIDDNVKMINIDEQTYNLSEENPAGSKFPITLEKKTSAEKCEFCALDKVLFTILLDKGLGLDAGFVAENEESEHLINIPISGEYSDALVMCEEGIAGSDDGGNSWVSPISEDFGYCPSSQIGKVMITPGKFCTQGSSNCVYKTTNPPTYSADDDISRCIDQYFSYSNPIDWSSPSNLFKRKSLPSLVICGETELRPNSIICTNITNPSDTKSGNAIFNKKCDGINYGSTQGCIESTDVKTPYCPSGYSYP